MICQMTQLRQNKSKMEVFKQKSCLSAQCANLNQSLTNQKLSAAQNPLCYNDVLFVHLIHIEERGSRFLLGNMYLEESIEKSESPSNEGIYL